ncbi:MAG: SRPBCC domain-containing protein [Polyangiales bacterium]
MPAPDSIRASIVLPASKERLYEAFLDPKEHAAFTGSPATGSAKTGSKFTAWDGYITGKHLELHPHDRIVQAWRTTDFPEGAPDSRLEISFAPATGGTRVTIAHDGLPAGDGERYLRGWKRFYFTPMRDHFRADESEPASIGAGRKSEKTKAAAKVRRPRGG